MEIAISPYSTNVTRPLPHDYPTKVTLFWERFYGWKFDIAKKMLDGYTSDDGHVHKPIPDSGYAAMDAMFSYFEPLGKHLEGYLDPNDKRLSGKYFKIGLNNVFDFSGYNQSDVDKLLDLLWSGIRCGLYHTGHAKHGVLITGVTPEAIRFAFNDDIVIVNPHKLVEGLIWHVGNYRDRLLKDGAQSIIGQNFLARYDYDNPSTI